MKIRENYDIIVETLPDYEYLNKALVRESLINLERGLVNKTTFSNLVGADKIYTDDPSNTSSPLLARWVGDKIRSYYNRKDASVQITYSIDMWFARYNKNDSCTSHDHLPFALFSFVYFVNTPKGSSPLVFTSSGKKIKAEEGKVVIFPSMMKHHVPSNKCENRLVVAGNVMSLRDL